MEIATLASFLAVAQQGGVQAAARKLKISPSTLSKALAKLEEELDLALFDRTAAGLALTSAGEFLKKQAVQILMLEERTRQELRRNTGSGRIVIAGPDLLLAKCVPGITELLQKFTFNAVFECLNVSETEAVDKVKEGLAHLALTTGRVAADLGLTVRILEKIQFKTFLGEAHPLYQKVKAKTPIAIDEVLKYPFAVPETLLFGSLNAEGSCDGWRDDQFRREIRFVTSSLRTLEALVESGQALAYPPELESENKRLIPLEMSGCSFQCQVSIRIVCKDPHQLGWLRQLF